jgi:hypothetical protein
MRRVMDRMTRLGRSLGCMQSVCRQDTDPGQEDKRVRRLSEEEMQTGGWVT